MRIDLGNYECNNGWKDENNTLFYATDWTGWDSPGIRQSTSDITGKHATAVLRGYRAARQVDVQGVFKATNEGAFWASYNAFLGYWADPNVTRTMVVYESVPKKLVVQTSGATRIDLSGGCAAKFSVSMIAGDPLKYQTTANSYTIAASGSQVVQNDGNWPVYPVITTSGSTCQVYVASTGKTFRATGIVATTTFDQGARTAYQSLTNVFSKVDMTSSWLAIPPGSSTVTNQGNGTITLSFNNGWM